MITFPTGDDRLTHDPAYTELYTGPFEDTVTGKEWQWNEAKQKWQPYLPALRISESETEPSDRNTVWGVPSTGEFSWYSTTNAAWMGVANASHTHTLSGIVDAGTAAAANLIDDETFTDPLATTVPSSLSVKAYVDANAGGVAEEVNFGATTQQFRAYSDGGTATFTIGTSAQSAFRTALGAGAAGDAIFTATTVVDVKAAMSVVKKITTSQSTRLNTVAFADDEQLSGWSVTAGGIYRIKGAIKFNAPSSGGIRMQMTHPASTAGATTYLGVQANAAVNTPQIISTASGGTITALGSYSAALVNGLWMFEFLYNATASGTLSMQWAQGQANNVTASTREIGSSIEVEHLNP